MRKALCIAALALAAIVAPTAALADGGTATGVDLKANLAANAAFPSVLTSGQARYRDDGTRRRIEVSATGAFAANQQLVLVINGLPTYTMTASAIPGSVTFSADSNDGASVPVLRAGATVQIWSANLLFAFGAGVLG